MKYQILISLVVLSSIITSCKDSDDIGENYRTFEGEMIATYVDHQENLSMFADLMKEADCFTLLKSYGKYTCFIPDNDAMKEWYERNQYTLDSLRQLSDEGALRKFLREAVFYHLIDGESNGVATFKTQDFPDGSFPVMNMAGRYLSSTVQKGTGAWCLKNADRYSTIKEPNIELINGVVHVVGTMLEGNNDLLPDFISGRSKYKIFAEAMLATGWRDSMISIEEPFTPPTSNMLPNGDTPSHSSTAFWGWPETKKTLFMAFAESDSIMQLREGIKDIDDLRAYAKKIYAPNGNDVDDETSPENSLHKFIGYHLYNVQRAKNKLVVNKGWVSNWDWHTWRDYICDDTYMVYQYYIPLQKNMLLFVQNANTKSMDSGSSTGVPVLNFPYSPYNSKYADMSNATELDGIPVIRLINEEADQYCVNGVLHGINNMLVYSNEVKSKVFHQRIRLDFRTFFPEGMNNGIFYDGDRAYNHFITSAPDHYFKNLKFTSDNNTYMMYEGTTPHDYLYGDHYTVTGNFDMTITVGPVPQGSYEVRISYNAGASGGAVVQVYIDGVPCGIPIDTRVSAYNGDTGWIQDWLAIQESGSTRFAGMGESEEDPYGFENDKNLRNHGFMKAPNSYVGKNYHNLGYGDNLSARNVDTKMRKILGINSWTSDGTHELRIVAMRAGSFDLDFIEFMPTDLIEDEDQH
ncbi:MAG: fasciclin domain-containing protein [Prevotellaceae bacterium]|nr:fasciclin domain-containing protein [Prevotellaceae bacterium]